MPGCGVYRALAKAQADLWAVSQALRGLVHPPPWLPTPLGPAGDPRYARAARRFWRRLQALEDCDGLYCTWCVHPGGGTLQCTRVWGRGGGR